MTLLAGLALCVWLYLALARGRFWSAGPMLQPARAGSGFESGSGSGSGITPQVAAIVPARDEASTIAPAIASLRAQDYGGPLSVVVVDDGSSDGTGAIARAVPGPAPLRVLRGAPRPRGWAGKLWAVEQGVAATAAPWLLLTDADVVHDARHLATLIAHAERSAADMVSEMVALRCVDRVERALVPAFVYFFQLLYPFAWVNDPDRATAAAAGGVVLIRRAALERAGGIAAIAGQLIDDVALAARVKRVGRIWLGHSALARSIRPYPRLADVWSMIARSAYVQLRYSPWLLAGTVAGLALLFFVPPAAALFGRGAARATGLIAWCVMAATFIPTLHRFGLSALRSALLPASAAFYLAATIGSALDHHRGRGVVWKRRAYTERQV